MANNSAREIIPAQDTRDQDRDGEIVGGTFEYLPWRVVVHGKPTFDEWRRAFHELAIVERFILWWLGDMLQYGIGVFGESSFEQIAQEYGYDIGTLNNAKYVSGRFPPDSRRYENLSWSHYYAAAPLSPEQARDLLSLADRTGLSSREIARRSLEIRQIADQRGGDLRAYVARAAGLRVAIDGMIAQADSLARPGGERVSLLVIGSAFRDLSDQLRDGTRNR